MVAPYDATIAFECSFGAAFLIVAHAADGFQLGFAGIELFVGGETGKFFQGHAHKSARVAFTRLDIGDIVIGVAITIYNRFDGCKKHKIKFKDED